MNLPLNVIKFFDPSRLFHFQPVIALSTIYFLLAFFGLLVVAAIAVKWAQKMKKREPFINRLLKKYFSLALTMGLVGLVWTWIRYEKVFLLSARFWFLIWLVGGLVWLGFILKYQLKAIPEAKKRLAEKQIFNKYLPKRK